MKHGLDVDLAHDRLDAVSQADAEEAVETAALDLAARRAAREPHPRSGPPPRCSACCRFLGGHPCPCGYVPGQGYAA